MNEVPNRTASIPNRRQRRLAMHHQGLLKQKANLSLTDWYTLCGEIGIKGNEIHQANVERNENAEFARLEKIESKKISDWREEGYNDKEIVKLREAFAIMSVKDKATWREDKKTALNLIKDASLSLQKRQ
jgi:hypothetical protein